MSQQNKATSDVDYLTWFGSLSDEEQSKELRQLRAIAMELGCVVNEHPFVSHDALDLIPPLSAPLGLN